jgi:phosphate starvation-inducible PhoH-like protein
MSKPDNQVSFNVTSTIQFELLPLDNQRLASLCGPVNQNLRQLEEFYGVKISCRSNQFEISGEGRLLKTVKNAIQTLYNVAGHQALTPTVVQLYLNDNIDDMTITKKSASEDQDADDSIAHSKSRHGKVSGRG